MDKTPIKCVICGKEFIPKKKSQQCCSSECARKKTTETVKKHYICQHCGKPFWKPDAFRVKYCGPECQSAARKELAEKNKKPKPAPIVYKRECAWCGKPFETRFPNKIYCCDDCGYESNKKQHRDKWAEEYVPRKVVCKECGTEFLTECGDMHSVFCSTKCAEKNKSRREHSTERHKQYMRRAKARREQQIRDAFVEAVSYEELFRRDEGVCRICGLPVIYDKFVDNYWSGTIDHIVPISLGGEHSMNNCQLSHRLCNSVKGQGDGNYSIDWFVKAEDNNYWMSKVKRYQQLMMTTPL